MHEYINEINEINKKNEEIGKAATSFIAQTVNFYNNLSQKPVCRPASQELLEKLQHQSIPAKGRPVEEVCQEMLQDIYADTTLAQHPRSFACVPSNASMLSWLGDMMTGAFNPHASCQINAPAANLIEKKLIHWLCNRAGYPEESCGGLFVSGGSLANLTALTAARDCKLANPEERSQAVIYVSDQTHSSVTKGLLIIGFCMEQVHIIPSDAGFRMDPAALQQAIETDLSAGRKPFAVVASAGTTNTGSIDPMQKISEICRKYNLWMHVDGAFGASALLSDSLRERLAGIENSDSLSWDAHKWMMQTYACSMVLVRDQSLLARSFAAHPEYLKDSETSEDGVEFWDLGPELTRPARSLKLWLTFQTLGSDAMGSVLDHGCAMADLAESMIRKESGWEISAPSSLGIVNFRYVGHGDLSEEEKDQINQAIARTITESGYALIFTTELHKHKVLRICSINPETTEEDIRGTIERLVQISKYVSYRMHAA